MLSSQVELECDLLYAIASQLGLSQEIIQL